MIVLALALIYMILMEFNAFDHILMNLTILTNFNEFYDFVILNDFE